MNYLPLLTWQGVIIFFSGVREFNFQVEPHFFPNNCQVHYRKIALIVEKTAREFGLSYNLQPTFWESVKSHVRKLKELGQPVILPQR